MFQKYEKAVRIDSLPVIRTAKSYHQQCTDVCPYVQLAASLQLYVRTLGYVRIVICLSLAVRTYSWRLLVMGLMNIHCGACGFMAFSNASHGSSNVLRLPPTESAYPLGFFAFCSESICYYETKIAESSILFQSRYRRFSLSSY